MNEHDSERVKDLLLQEGYSLVNVPEEAGIVLFNTCSVRQHAEDRVYGKVGTLMALKEKKPGLVIGILGCMAEAQKDLIFMKLPHVDFLCGPADLDKIPDIIKKIRDGAGHIMCLEGHRSKRLPEFPGERHAGKNNYVKIMEGCNNFCSYCVVPYVRGQERSRALGEILDEVKRLISAGACEITLLGQNVNSYGRGLREKIDFPGLLEKIDKIVSNPPKSPKSNQVRMGGVSGVEVSFVTSHPKDAGIKLFKAMSDLKSISKNLHLPMQSGSDKILKRMNRGYTIEKYKKLVGDFRRIVKGGTITTDIIVGFPGESEKDFKDTLEAVKKIQFDAAYIFKYSPRPVTKASMLKDDVTKEEKETRHALLLETQKEISRKKCQ
jgi:tRNA-2-methylthio-N6-dimethylallyladenosine synthase